MTQARPDRERIAAEVRRLAPWYYAFDFGGVSTTTTPPCDLHGHRRVQLPAAMRRVLAGRSVLDVACNEGAYSFAALQLGASRVEAFDCRAVNVEKARFAARMLGHDRADFHVATCEDWLARAQPVDFVFLCGLLYHLADPLAVIAGYCRLAREGVYVTSALAGGPDGWTPGPETDTIAAGVAADMTALVPNTTSTIVREFGRHGFQPLHLVEGSVQSWWGTCTALFAARRGWVDVAPARGSAPARAFDVHVVPIEPRGTEPARAPDVEVGVLIRNRTPVAQTVHGTLTVQDASGAALATHGPHRLERGPAWPAAPTVASECEWLRVALPPGAARLEVRVEGAMGADVAVIERRS